MARPRLVRAGREGPGCGGLAQRPGRAQATSARCGVGLDFFTHLTSQNVELKEMVHLHTPYGSTYRT